MYILIFGHVFSRDNLTVCSNLVCVFDVFVACFLCILAGVLLAMLNCSSGLHVIIVMVSKHTFLYFEVFCLLVLCVGFVCMLLEVLYLGMSVLCFCLETCVYYLSFVLLAHVSCMFTCAILHLCVCSFWRYCFVFTWVCSLTFLLVTKVLLETCFCYLCDVCVSNCFYLSMYKGKL